ncbi:hypothetical protein I6J77_14100 [Rhodanobacter sp. FDAARGOS 1247]|uniref:hypothetical protein n=1 Tax=Rhodanobacter sp. FDAARGOS 1247 TaxID=2778082 RepID=UPI00194DEF9A|nr:hypothetical protein [Rhodanobacter sp. FDAARGOS 1247]QRP63235.1 hypothetical protein I6J77_14100 [Rhodanobacter sp. FDAARGOS 1247]
MANGKLSDTIHHEIVTVLAKSVQNRTQDLIKKPTIATADNSDIGGLLSRLNEANLHSLLKRCEINRVISSRAKLGPIAESCREIGWQRKVRKNVDFSIGHTCHPTPELSGGVAARLERNVRPLGRATTGIRVCTCQECGLQKMKLPPKAEAAK